MHGGKRPGAGRKPGSKALATRQAIEAAGAGELPLEYMLKVMRDPNADDKRRDQMAIAAASYLHPRLSNITANFTQSKQVVDMTDEALLQILEHGKTRLDPVH